MADDRSLETLTADDFRAAQGSRFQLTTQRSEHGRQVALPVELADVTQAAEAPSDPFRKPFSVLFHGPIEPVLPQGIYRFEHDQIGVLDLFIVPVGPHEPSDPGSQPTAMRYEAVFG